jgi:hypothetical protein
MNRIAADLPAPLSSPDPIADGLPLLADLLQKGGACLADLD